MVTMQCKWSFFFFFTWLIERPHWELPSRVRNAAWELVTTWLHAHTNTCKGGRKKRRKKPPLVPSSMPKQAAPDTAVVFSTDNLLPQMPKRLNWSHSGFFVFYEKNLAYFFRNVRFLHRNYLTWFNIWKFSSNIFSWKCCNPSVYQIYRYKQAELLI